MQTGMAIIGAAPWTSSGSGMHMVVELTAYIGRPVYNHKGSYVGTVSNVIIDLPNRKVGSLLIGRTNPAIIDGGRDVAVPYRWVSALGDVVLLNTFPEHVTIMDAGAAAEEEPVQA